MRTVTIDREYLIKAPCQLALSHCIKGVKKPPIRAVAFSGMSGQGQTRLILASTLAVSAFRCADSINSSLPFSLTLEYFCEPFK